MTEPAVAVPAPSMISHAPIAPGSSRRLTILGLTLLLLFLAALYVPGFTVKSRYWLPLFSKYMALALFALSVDLIWGYTGLLSLGQGLYFGLGAYALGYSLKLQRTAQAAGEPPGTVLLPDFMEYCRLPEVPVWVAPLIHIWMAIAVAVILPALVATVFGLVTFRLRIRDVFFSIITQALVLAMFTFVVNQQP